MGTSSELETVYGQERKRIKEKKRKKEDSITGISLFIYLK
jgi:hypothetical protein